ncbi:MAG: type II toxin-antitoxin system VapC family toxin [Propionibacteriaceae bacterium]|nr:type II toxin-antitoxin system VapC family toxin [Propionibacteriaceae bacterium]
MTYLLDTNVISELRKSPQNASPVVREWVRRRTQADLYLSVVTILEIEVGIARLQRHDHLQANRLELWLERIMTDGFLGRVLPVDIPVARCAAQMHVPDPRPERDALIAATAVVHDLTVVTRNVHDFADMAVRIVDPWAAS